MQPDSPVMHSSKMVLAKVENVHQTVYSDEMGHLPVQSNKENKFPMVYYDLDGNFIDAKPLCDHHNNSLIQGYQNIWQCTTHKCTVKPKMQILDNKASVAFKNAIRENCDLQLVPPDTHQQNLSKRVI